MAFASRPRSMSNSKVSQSADEEKALLRDRKNEQQQMWAGQGETVMSYSLQLAALHTETASSQCRGGYLL